MKSMIRAFAGLLIFTLLGVALLCGCAYPYEKPIVLTDHTSDPETDERTLPDIDPRQVSSEVISEAVSPASEEKSSGAEAVFDVSSEAMTSDVVSEQGSDVTSESPIDRTVPVDPQTNDDGTYVLNLSSRKIHLPECSSAAKIGADNKCTTNRTLNDLIAAGYMPCGICLKDKTAEKTDNAGNTDTGNTDRNHDNTGRKYVLNTSSKKIHLPDCSSVKRIAEKNYSETTDPQAYLSQGYEACKICKPFG